MEKRVKDKEVDNEIRKNLEGLSPEQANIFLKTSDTGWFRSYAKKSKTQLEKITKKVKDGISRGYYVCKGKKGKDVAPVGWKGGKIKSPTKESKIKYRRTKSGKKIARSYSSKTIKRVISASKKYPDASNYELRHGVNSAASRKYREHQGLSKNYEGRIITRKK